MVTPRKRTRIGMETTRSPAARGRRGGCGHRSRAEGRRTRCPRVGEHRPGDIVGLPDVGVGGAALEEGHPASRSGSCRGARSMESVLTVLPSGTGTKTMPGPSAATGQVPDPVLGHPLGMIATSPSSRRRSASRGGLRPPAGEGRDVVGVDDGRVPAQCHGFTVCRVPVPRAGSAPLCRPRTRPRTPTASAYPRPPLAPCARARPPYRYTRPRRRVGAGCGAGHRRWRFRWRVGPGAPVTVSGHHGVRRGVPVDAPGIDRRGRLVTVDDRVVSAAERVAFDRSVGPPSTQCRTWCASHQAAGAEQPGKVQPRSRSQSALTWAGWKSRCPPQSSTLLGPPSTAGMIWASQARRRTVSGANSVSATVEVRTVPAPIRAFEVVEVHRDDQGRFARPANQRRTSPGPQWAQ